jgi:FkbM family methyltransferase
MKNIKEQLMELLPNNAFLYRVCKRYVDRYNSENNGDIHTNGELRFMQTILPKCETVFDVGANVGDWMALALDINPRLQVHCFEPSLATFKRLQAREGEAIRNNFGLSSASGEMTLWVFAAGAGINSLYKRQGLEDGYGLGEQQQAETVRLDTLDEYCQRVGVDVIDLMKVDVEGHELEVFKGAVGMLAEGKIKRIQFEYGGCNIDSGALLKDLFGFFVPYGYSFYKIFPQELRHVSRYDQRLETFQYQNWVVVANDVSF